MKIKQKLKILMFVHYLTMSIALGVKGGNSGTLSNFIDCKVILQQMSSVFLAIH
jgi:hypothetical protein